MTAEEGLRALKKRKTRRDIVASTLKLSLEHSYRSTTIPMIAERAMVSPRTVSTYFPNKDDIAFDGSAETIDELVTRLDDHNLPLVDRLRQWIAERSARHDEELENLRWRAITHDADLRLIEHRYLDRFSDAVAAAVAAELDAEPSGPGPQTFAAAFLGVVLALRSRPAEKKSVDNSKVQLEAGFKFLEAGLASLRAERARTAAAS